MDISKIEDVKLPEPESALKKLQDYNVSVLERKELGPASFYAAIDPANRIISTAKNIQIDDLIHFTEGQRDNIRQLCDEALQKFQEILNFNFDDHNRPTDVRDSLVNNLIGLVDSFFTSLMPYVSYASSQRSDTEQTKRQIQKISDDLQKEADVIRDDISKKAKEADGLISSIKKAAAKGGTLEQAEHFREEKAYHRKRSQWWAAGTLISAAILLVYTVFSIKFHTWFNIDLEGEGKEALAIQVTTTKILIFSILAYLLMLSVRNFMSHKHNMVVNRHREVALHTFEALAKAANQDSGARDIILTHASACIFTPQETGYAKTSNSPEGSSGLSGTSLALSLVKRSVGKDEAS